MNSTGPKKISLVAKCLAAVISTCMTAYGLFIITTKYYYGYKNKYGGAEVAADGSSAVLIGIAMIIIGLTPMALWAKSGKVAGLWAGSCMILGILLFLAPFYIHVN